MIALYGHPFAAFTWKALIALYEREVPFEFRMLGPDHPQHAADIARLSPTGQMPALLDGDVAVTGSNAVIECLDLYHGDAAPMVPADPRAALKARELTAVFDSYVAHPMQAIVSDALRVPEQRDALAVEQARLTLDRSYAWLDERIGEQWATGEEFGLADCAAAPALFYADWAHPIPERHAALRAYRARLLPRPSVARVVDEARPYRSFFPLGAPDRD